MSQRRLKIGAKTELGDITEWKNIESTSVCVRDRVQRVPERS